MDVDEDEDATQRPKAVADYGIEIDFDSVDDDDREKDPAEAVAELDKDIAKISSEIERMAPNMKAMERYVLGQYTKRITGSLAEQTGRRRGQASADREGSG